MSRFQEGQKVMRMLAGTIPMPMTITNVHEGLAHCGPWTFDDETGIEEDAELGFGVGHGITGSYIKECTDEEWEDVRTRENSALDHLESVIDESQKGGDPNGGH